MRTGAIAEGAGNFTSVDNMRSNWYAGESVDDGAVCIGSLERTVIRRLARGMNLDISLVVNAFKMDT